MLNLSVFDLLVPIFVIITAIVYLPVTLFIAIKNRQTSDLTSWRSFQQAWFSRFWSFFGWASRPLFAPDVERVVSNSRGVVVDVGSGSGDWLYLFSKGRNQNISKLYLVEPNTGFHPALQRKVRDIGLEGTCQIVERVEDLENMGVQPGTVDTVCTVHVLCSVESAEPLIKALYQYLKPGGQWLVYEHVKVRNEWAVTGVCQAGINTIWPMFLDGCSMTRDTENLLLHGGKWTSADLRPGTNEGWFNPLPHIVGVLVK